jgi:capsular polysaccharide biosynthesis protein
VSEQIIDLRSTWAVLRRRRVTLMLAAALGAAGGATAAYFIPPAYSSVSMVLLAPPAAGGNAASSHTIETQVEIANSQAVLGPARQAVSPTLSQSEIERRVEVSAATEEVLSIKATGTTAEEAVALAGAVADAEVAYLNSASSQSGEEAKAALATRRSTLDTTLAAVTAEIRKTQDRLGAEDRASTAGRADAAALAELTAQQADILLQIDKIEEDLSAIADPTNSDMTGGSLIQEPSPGVVTSRVLRIAAFVVAGASVLLFLAATFLVLRQRQDRTLRSRDEIADAVGIPVVASLPADTPRSVAGWSGLMAGYSPDDVGKWTLRQLRRLITPGAPGSLSQVGAATTPAHVVVVSVADDHAVALGPQFASFAASTGTATELVTAGSHHSADALWAACAAAASEGEPRPGLTVNRPSARSSAELVVHVVVMNPRRPILHVDGADHAVVLLAVSPGAATAEDLARLALAADDAGHPIARVVVVNPDPLDRTTGRLLASDRAAHVPLPFRMTGSAPLAETSGVRTRRRLG